VPPPKHGVLTAGLQVRKAVHVFLAAGGSSGNPLGTLLIFALIFGAMYLLLIRPQQKRRRQAMEMQNSIGVGDEVVTIGGLHATVVAMEDDIAHLEAQPGVVLRYARGAISRVITPAATGDDDADSDESDENDASKVIDEG
jgi:preprotein translocase subunit YajC